MKFIFPVIHQRCKPFFQGQGWSNLFHVMGFQDSNVIGKKLTSKSD